MSEERTLTPQEKYDKKATKKICMKLNLVYDADVLEKLDSVPNKQGYIKELIRKDIAENK